MKSCVESCSDYTQMDDDLDTIKLLATIKKLIYSGGTHELNVCHNMAMAHMSLMNLFQDRFLWQLLSSMSSGFNIVGGDVIANIIRWLNKRFRKEVPLATNIKKVLEYLGLTLD